MAENGICRDHSGVCQEIKAVVGDVADHEDRLRTGTDLMAEIKSDLRTMKWMIVLAVLASFLGGAVGPEIWKAFGLVH